MAKFKEGKNGEANHFYSQFLNVVNFSRMDLHDPPIDSEDMFRTPDRTVVQGGQ
jgi:hypothetical protein